MEYIYSAMLLHSAGKKITAENVKKVLTAAGVKADDGRIKALVASLDGVNIEEAVKTTAIPAAATVAPVPTSAASEKPAAPGEAPAEKKEEKKKKEEKEVSEEEAAAGLSALFD